MPNSYFGRRLREQNTISGSSDDEEIARLLAALMDVPSEAPSPAAALTSLPLGLAEKLV